MRPFHGMQPPRKRHQKLAQPRGIPLLSVTGATLRSFAVFAATPLEPLENLARGCMVRRFGPNTRVVRTGEAASFVYLVASGSLNVLAGNEDGREAILAVLKQGELFGEMGVLDEQARCATIVAATQCVLIAISRTDFKSFMKDNFDVTEYVIRTLIARLRTANRRIESLALLDVPGRVLGVLRDLADSDGAEQLSLRKYSIQEIAKMVGASREMVSRVMKDLTARGEIVIDDGRIMLKGHVPSKAPGLPAGTPRGPRF
ncbi:MAG: Crp/Fnr family transcriptional regulator [Rhodocyclaceae bacterium]